MAWVGNEERSGPSLSLNGRLLDLLLDFSDRVVSLDKLLESTNIRHEIGKLLVLAVPEANHF